MTTNARKLTIEEQSSTQCKETVISWQELKKYEEELNNE